MALVDYDPITKEWVAFEWNEADETFTLGHHQDVTPILEANKLMQLDTERTAAGIKEEFWHYAKIPNIIAMKWLKEKGVDIFDKGHEKAVFALLNDPEYLYLKTTHKKHAIK